MNRKKINRKSEGINFAVIAKTIGNEQAARILLRKFLNELAEDKRQIDSAIKQADFLLLAKLAHKLKGAASYCVLSRLQDTAAALETAAKKSQKKQIINLFQDLSLEIDNVLEEAKDI
jgi:HPt (histidine-containing phosphotransfer) domain-containing protein